MLYDNRAIKFQRNLPKCGQVVVIGFYVPHISKSNIHWGYLFGIKHFYYIVSNSHKIKRCNF